MAWLGIVVGLSALGSLVWMSAEWGALWWFLAAAVIAWCAGAGAAWRFRGRGPWLPLVVALLWIVGVEAATHLTCNTTGVLTVRRCFSDSF